MDLTLVLKAIVYRTVPHRFRAQSGASDIGGDAGAILKPVATLLCQRPRGLPGEGWRPASYLASGSGNSGMSSG